MRTIKIVMFLMSLFMIQPAEARHHHESSRHTVHRHHTHGTRHAHHRSHVHHREVHRLPAVVMLPHPDGCPHRLFCGCGAALDVFGKHVRHLWLAANWYSYPRSPPGYNTVGVRPHHVLVLKHHVSGTIWMVNDYNSGGHLSRYHAVDISRYTIVSPR